MLYLALVSKYLMKRVHFIAIGGSAMHNLALALHREGYRITGSDDEIAEPSRSRLLKAGILPEKIGWYPEKITDDTDQVIVGMHARKDNPELLRAIEMGIQVFSYPEYLYERAKQKKRIVIAGSHGKTTITSMILHVLQDVGIDSDYMVGAQLEGFEIMVRLSDSAKFMILEGDEYLTSPIDSRPKFIHYKPDIAVISGIGWDHMNVFPTFEKYLDQFRMLIKDMPLDGTLVYFSGDTEVVRLAGESMCQCLPYNTHPHTIEKEMFLLQLADGTNVPVKIFGSHNMSNISAALQVCRLMGVGDEQFYRSVSTFSGASLRLQLVKSGLNKSVYRDFAHAPSKVKASVKALREKYPERSLIACLELHTYSSLSKNFIDQYHGSLNDSDQALVFYDPHAVALKKLPPLEFNDIRKAFGFNGLVVCSDPREIDVFINQYFVANSTIVFMSSGSFAGYNLNNLII
jgi:UDP-N-acetylmuramate: L-alanyl-gamma-D-glutamyl-meso-diaminopimelate ligase